MNYPFYEAVNEERLEQGDILLNCPVFSTATVDSATESFTVQAEREIFDVIILTQSCDLENNKLPNVLVCAIFNLETAKKEEPKLTNRDVLKQIIDGKRFRYSLLAKSDLADMGMEIHIVDFGRAFSLPKPFVQEFAKAQGKRLRLLPPYREHLSQAFARFFMRVGLPQNIELPS